MDLYIDLEKALNRGKLVQRRVMVRGKNGKIYYRMQWVDPHTGEPVSEHHAKQEEQPTHHVHAQDPDFDNQKDFIDHHVKKMPRDEKYSRLKQYGVDWKHNDHPAIDHKNAVEALKQHLYKNPHLAGAEHLPKDKDPNKTKTGMNSIVDFTNGFKKRPELLYKMMKELGIAPDGDPRLVPEWKPTSEGGNGMGAIRHMKNMMELKKHFDANPEVFQKMLNHPEYGNGSGDDTKPAPKAPPKQPKQPTQPQRTKSPEPQPTVTKAPPSTAQKGGNTIKGILDAMSSEDKYALCKKLGIADGDPRQDPNIKQAMRPIHHMKFMMELKKRIEADPSILNTDPVTDGLSQDEQNRLAGLKDKEKTAEDVHNFLLRASKQLKLQWANDFSDHDMMKNRHTNPNENIDNMHKLAALKKILTDDPSLMDELKPELENEELENIKIGNKMMGKILRDVVGLKGIGDVTMGYDKGKEWEFGDESTAMIQRDDNDQLILSVYHVDKEGNEHDIAIPMKKVKEFLDKVKSGEQAPDIKPEDIPLHRKPLKSIWDALENDFDDNYTKEVGDVLKKSVSDLWVKSGKSSMLSSISSASLDLYPFAVTKGTLEKLLEKYNVPIDKDFVAKVDTNSDNFKKVVYGHLVEKTKSKNAVDYLQQDANGKNDTWVLHQSAKQWSSDERTEARKDFIKHNLHIEDVDKDYGQSMNYTPGEYGSAEDRTRKIVNHLHKSLEAYPFDIMTDTFANGCSLHFRKTSMDGSGDPHVGNYHNAGIPGIVFNHGYINDMESLDEEHPMYHRPGRDKNGYIYHKFSDTCAHEFAHAIDNYMSGGTKYLQWDKTAQGKKYAGKYTNAVPTSYKNAVEKSNPKLNLAVSTGSQPYALHLDEWMDNYEGRIYDWRYYGDNPTGYEKDPATGKIRDTQWDNTGIERGLEHWSENVSRAINAFHSYKEWRDLEGDGSTDFDTWAERMHDDYTAEGYGDASNSRDSNSRNPKYLHSYRSPKLHTDDRPVNKMPLETYGYLWHTMTKRHPHLAEAIKHIIFRPDFVGDKSVTDPISRAEKDDYTRKSEMDLIINLGE